MKFGWTQAKRDKTLAERQIDFAAMTVGFLDPGRKIARDLRKDYGEERFNILENRATGLSHYVYDVRLGHLDHFGAQGQREGAKTL